MIPFGLGNLEDNAEYDVRGGLGNKVLMNVKTEDGIIYTKLPEETEWKVATPPPITEDFIKSVNDRWLNK